MNIAAFQIELRRYVKLYFLFRWRGDFLCHAYSYIYIKNVLHGILYFFQNCNFELLSLSLLCQALRNKFVGFSFPMN